MSKKLVIFAGTAEGRMLAEFVSKMPFAGQCIFSVATEYGSELISEYPGITVHEGRMDENAIRKFLTEQSCEAVIDSTHPYAKEVTCNIREAAGECGVEYIRLLRREICHEGENIITLSSMGELSRYINQHDGRFFVTTGSKELHLLKSVDDKERLVVRVLPSVESINLCKDAEIPSKNIVAMQGPFTAEMNLATLAQYNCDYLVTKSTGKPGGFDDKLQCCEDGYKLVVIERPLEEEGLSLEQCKKKVVDYFEK